MRRCSLSNQQGHPLGLPTAPSPSLFRIGRVAILRSHLAQFAGRRAFPDICLLGLAGRCRIRNSVELLDRVAMIVDEENDDDDE
mgnify:CR=1 FL=1